MIQLRLDQRLNQRMDVSDVIQDVLVEANRRLQDYLQKSCDTVSSLDSTNCERPHHRRAQAPPIECQAKYRS